MKSASNFWIFLILTTLLFNCATKKSGSKALPMEKAYVLLRTEGSEKEINELTNVLNSNFVTNKIASDINYYASGRTWNINQIFTTAYNNNYDYIVLIDQIAKFTIDEKTNVGGKYQIRSYHVKSSNPDWVDLGQKTCNVSVRQSIDKFSEQIISEIVPNYVAPKVTFNLNDQNFEKRKTGISAVDYNQLKSSEEIDNEIVELRKELEKEKKRTDKVIAEKEKLEKEYEEVLSFQKKKNETIIEGLESLKRKRVLEEIKRQEEIKLTEEKKKEAKAIAESQELERKRIKDERLAEAKKEEEELRKKELEIQAEKERLAEIKRQEEIELVEIKKKEEKALAEATELERKQIKDERLAEAKKEEEELRKKELEIQAEKERLAEIKRQEEIELVEIKKKEEKALAEATELERKQIKDERLAEAKKEEEELRKKELEIQAEKERLAEIKRQEVFNLAELKKKEAKALAEAQELELKRIEEKRLADVKRKEQIRLAELDKKALKKEKTITVKTKKSTNKKDTGKNVTVPSNKSNALIIIRGRDENNGLYKDLQDNLEFELLFANIKASTQILNTEKAFDKANVLNWNKSQYKYLILINQLENKENSESIFKISIHSDKTDSDWKDLDNKSYDLSERISLKEFSKTVLKSL